MVTGEEGLAPLLKIAEVAGPGTFASGSPKSTDCTLQNRKMRRLRLSLVTATIIDTASGAVKECMTAERRIPCESERPVEFLNH